MGSELVSLEEFKHFALLKELMELDFNFLQLCNQFMLSEELSGGVPVVHCVILLVTRLINQVKDRIVDELDLFSGCILSN
jgi:hypothetical protein